MKLKQGVVFSGELKNHFYSSSVLITEASLL